MKHRTITIALVTALLLFSLLGSFSSSDASGSKKPSQTTDASSVSRPSLNNEQSPVQDREEEGGSDPDLPPGGARIDEGTYILMREAYVARLRGWEPGKPFDATARRRAIEQMEQQELERPTKDTLLGRMESVFGVAPAVIPVWTELGPNPIPNGQTQTVVSPVSGRVSAIEIDPSDPNKVYVGAAQGGVYRSLDGGATWTPIFDSAQSLAIGSLTLDAVNGRLWVGTGEANGSLDSAAGVGLYRIENVNTSADLFGPINPVRNYTDNNGISRSAPVFNGRSISKILIVPGDPTTLLVGSAGGTIGIGGNVPFGNSVPPLGMRGLYKLANATGAPVAVTRIAVSTTNTGQNLCLDTPCTVNRSVNDMVFDLSDPTGNTLVVWLNGINITGDGGIYRSINVLSGSPTFTQTLVTTSTSTSNGRGIFAIAQKAPSPALIYVASGEPSTVDTLCNSASSSGALRRSIDGGVTWSGKLPGGGGFCSGQCFYNIGIDLARGATTATDKILIGGNVRSTNCAKLQGTSSDGAATVFANTDVGLHADTHVIKIAPSNTNIVYRGDDGGIWRSPDGGGTWSSLNNATFRATQFQSIAVHPTDRDFTIGGTQDNGTEKLATGPVWTRSDGGDGGYALIDQNATNTTNVTMYHTYFNSSGSQVGFNRSTNGGASWLGFVGCGGTANGIDCSDAVNFYAPMTLGPGNPNTVYYGSDRLYRSTDTGLTMTLVSQGPLVTGVPVSAIGISPQADSFRIVGLNNGALFYTTAGSSTLTSLDPVGSGTIPDFYVARIVFDPANKNTAYLSLGNYAGGTASSQSHVWRVSNLSTTPVLTPMNGNGINTLPDVPVNGFAIDPLNSNNLYAGTDIGVYNSTDGGVNWSPYGTGLPRVAVFDIAIQGSNRWLRIATHGRGMWETPLISPGASTVQFSTSAASVNEGQVSKTITVTRAGDTSFPASVNYGTSDTSGANNCNVNTGSASARCDYIATSGTLNFAANETSKNVLIPIVDDTYFEGSETFTMTLSAAGGSNVTLGGPSTITVTINDNEVIGGGTNQIDTSSFFVRQHYIDFLNREPDTPGLNFWTNNINGCSPQPSCTEITRINTSAAFFISIEFQDTGYLVYRFYKAAYGDGTGTSTTGGSHSLSVPIIRLGEFLPDTQRIGQGVIVNQGNWQQQIELNKQAFTEEFVQRSRFLTAYPLTLTPAQFVDLLNAKAATSGVNPLSPAQRDQLVSDLAAGIQTRAQVLRAVAENSTLYSAEYNRAFVLMQYFGYLRRNPNDPLDTDYAGYEFWLGKLNQFNGNFINAEMVKSFMVSAEYRQRFGG